LINTDGMKLSDALLMRVKELSYVVYAAIGANDIQNRLKYAEYLRNEAEAISFAAARLIGELKREIEQLQREEIARKLDSGLFLVFQDHNAWMVVNPDGSRSYRLVKSNPASTTEIQSIDEMLFRMKYIASLDQWEETNHESE
jgi:hypothetical protein